MTVDTSREAVEMIAANMDALEHHMGEGAAATLRALLAERDAARAACAQWKRAAEEHGGRYWEARYRDEAASASTAFARGAEAMRERAAGAAEHASVFYWTDPADHAENIAAAIRALPLPGPEDKR